MSGLVEMWIISELCSGGSLWSQIAARVFHLAEDDQLSLSKTTHTLHEIAKGVEYLHSRSLVHGDLSSNNILLLDGDDLVVKITDFGNARLIANDAAHGTYTLGTVAYMPPELFTVLTKPYLTSKADIYAIGVLTWELLTGSIPWGHLHRPQIVVAVSMGRRLELPVDSRAEIEELF